MAKKQTTERPGGNFGTSSPRGNSFEQGNKLPRIRKK